MDLASSDTLDGTTWDVVIVGTDVAQSLVALALSRSGKKILHVDENDYYGASHAAFTLQEAQVWVEKLKGRTKTKGTAEQLPESDVAACGKGAGVFRNASISTNEEGNTTVNDSAAASKLSFSRAYSLSLSPQIIYSRSQLLKVLVSSKAFKQLEFLTVGSFWVYSTSQTGNDGLGDEPPKLTEATRKGLFRRVPNGREDIFSDGTISPQEKRNMMKFLRFISQYEESKSTCQPWASRPLASFLTEKFGIPASIHDLLYALTMLSDYPENITTEIAMDCFHRHVTSIGVFGPSFPAVVPRWGGMSEVAQVACRAGAVGGGVYVLGKSIGWAESSEPQGNNSNPPVSNTAKAGKSLKLDSGEKITTRWIVGSEETLPRFNSKIFSSDSVMIDESNREGSPNGKNARHREVLSRSVSIVSSPLDVFLAHRVEGAPAPAVAVVYFPAGAFELDQASSESPPRHAPIQILIHSSDTGECPSGQCVLYASTMMPLKQTSKVLDRAVEELLNYAVAEERDAVTSATSESLESLAIPTRNDGGEGHNQLMYDEVTEPSKDATMSAPPRPRLRVLWSMRYEQDVHPGREEDTASGVGVVAKAVDSASASTSAETKEMSKSEQLYEIPTQPSSDHDEQSKTKIALLPSALQKRMIPSELREGKCWTSSDYLVFDDEVVSRARIVWEEIMGFDISDKDGEGNEEGGEGESAAKGENGHEVGKDTHEQLREGGRMEFMMFGDREVEADDDGDVGDVSNSAATAD